MKKETGMKSRVLGYGGALVLVAVALAILVDLFTGGDHRAGPQTPTAAGGPQVSGVPAPPQYSSRASDVPVSSGRPQASEQSAPRPDFGTGGNAGAAGRGLSSGTSPCPARSAGYQRFGDMIRVTVNFPGTGYVAAFVEATGRESMTKSATNTGRPQTFDFPGVPADITQRVGVTVITGAGLRTCDVPAKN
ncbi:MAG: hypothetical protein JWO67_7362 [Streptosporangiaceae bacterium]|jgi:hypothetical protein|nr:hypothetical protein [Streptosporangiaceae bacterium]